MAVTEAPQRGVEVGRGGDEPDVTNEWLHDHSRDLRAPPREHGLDGRHIVERHRQREPGDGGRHARAVREPQGGDAGAGLHEKAVAVSVVTAVELE